MLRPEEIELVHREIDGESTPHDRVAFQALVARQPEARALAAELRELAALLGRVEQRDPPPGLRPAVLEALRQRSRSVPETASTGDAVHALVQRFVLQLRSATIRMEHLMITKRTLVLGSTLVAAVAVVAAVLTGYPPTGREAGTMGGLQSDSGEKIAGVQQAARFRNKAVTERDVALGSPAVQLLFQNDKILSLVKSDVFREAMKNDAFRELQSSDAFRNLMASDAYRQLQANPAYRELQANPAYRELQGNPAFRELQANQASRELQASQAYRELQGNQAFRELQGNQAFRELQGNQAFRELASNQAFRELMANQAFRELQANQAFRELMSNDAYRQLQANETFRSLSRSQAATEAFLTQAMRVQE